MEAVLPLAIKFSGPMSLRIGAVICAIIALSLIIAFAVLVQSPTYSTGGKAALAIFMILFTGISGYLFYKSSIALNKAIEAEGGPMGMLSTYATGSPAAMGLVGRMFNPQMPSAPPISQPQTPSAPPISQASIPSAPPIMRPQTPSAPPISQAQTLNEMPKEQSVPDIAGSSMSVSI